MRPVRAAITGKKAPKHEDTITMKTEAILRPVRSFDPPPEPQFTESSDMIVVKK